MAGNVVWYEGLELTPPPAQLLCFLSDGEDLTRFTTGSSLQALLHDEMTVFESMSQNETFIFSVAFVRYFVIVTGK